MHEVPRFKDSSWTCAAKITAWLRPGTPIFCSSQANHGCMKTTSLFLVCCSLALASSGAPASAADSSLTKLRAVPFTQVQIHDTFWAPRQETNRLASIPVNLAMLEKSGNIRNLELAAAKATNCFTGPAFMYSPTSTALQPPSYSLTT